MKVLLIILFVLAGLLPSAYTQSPTACSAFCTYTYSGLSLISGCTNILSTGCTTCDTTYFRYVAPNCVSHNLYGQFLDNNYTVDWGWSGSYSISTTLGDSAISFNLLVPRTYANKVQTITHPHFAVRVRFFVWRNTASSYDIEYGIDQTQYQYTPQTHIHSIQADIVTSPKQSHQLSTCQISFKIQSYTCDICCAGCAIGCGCCSCQCNCEVQVKDVMLFVSRCQDGCNYCSNMNYCSSCGINQYGVQTYLYDMDHLCYATCPQATFNSTLRILLNNTGIFQNYCAACNPLCIECNITADWCYKCYNQGKNESFWWNYTCVLVCPNGYAPQFDNHTCQCPSLNFYEVKNITWQYLCLPCAIQCLTCIGPTNLDCTSCTPGYFLSYGTTYCLIECPTGQYSWDLTSRCYLCDPTCSACIFNSTYCTECFFVSKMMYLLDHLCVPSCPKGYSMDNLTRTCIMCPPFTYSYLGVCYADCPTGYAQVESNRSCMLLSQTDYRQQLQFIALDVVPGGKSLRFTVFANEGLSSSSINWILTQSYFLVTISVTNSSTFGGPLILSSRLLQSTTLPILNVNVSSPYIYFYTQMIPLNPYQVFSINFGNRTTDMAGVQYYNATNTFSLSDHPQIIRDYYYYCVRNYFNAYVIPILVVFCFVIFLRFKGMYQIMMQSFRVIQIMGLLAANLFPINQNIYLFVAGLNYSNLSFIPNLYAMFVGGNSSYNMTSYYLQASDMQFIRSVGSIMLFGVCWALLVIMVKCLCSQKSDTASFLIDFGLDIVQVKVMSSFWLSLIYVCSNYKSADLIIFLTHTLGLIFMMIILYRHRRTYSFNRVSPFFIWRLLGTLLLTLTSFASLLILGLLMTLSIVVAVAAYGKVKNGKNSISLAQINANNYDSDLTILTAHDFDEPIALNRSLIVRNFLLFSLPFIASICIGLLLLYRSNYIMPIATCFALISFILVFDIILAVLIKFFLRNRWDYLIKRNLNILKSKYIDQNHTSAQEPIRIDLYDEKSLENAKPNAARQQNQWSMMKMVE